MNQACLWISVRQNPIRMAIHTNQALATALPDLFFSRRLILQSHILVILEFTCTPSPYLHLSTLLSRTTALISHLQGQITSSVERSVHSPQETQALHNFMPLHQGLWVQRLLELDHLPFFHHVLFLVPVLLLQVRICRSRHIPESHRRLLLWGLRWRISLETNSMTRGNFLSQLILQHLSLAVPPNAAVQLQAISCLTMKSLSTSEASKVYPQMDCRTLGSGFKNRSRVARRSLAILSTSLRPRATERALRCAQLSFSSLL